MEADPTSAQATRIYELFSSVIDLPQGDRSAALHRECGDDDATRLTVQELLEAHERSGRFLADPTVPPDRLGSLLHDAPTVSGDMRRLGGYFLRRVIGEGGFGTVWLAEQRSPIQRTVAIKVIKLGMDTRQVIARFNLERQALALMDHPNIARIFDAGSTADGRPYFVMEWVDGSPLIDYCRAKHIDSRGRLALFIAVCSAVQHAHQKGIIHRDLKPSNVLVTVAGGMAAPKVIDFGIAKALEPSGAGLTITAQRQFLGTPQYMSPEQASASQDVDTRTDIYSIGVLLYELLADQPPFDPDVFRSVGSTDVHQLIRETDPPAPSVRLREAADAVRATDPERAAILRRQADAIRGDLDWIVMRAMEKDRTRRYASADALADDIGRYLHGATVSAVPPSRVYRLRKFARRNRLVLTGAALVSVALCAGLGATLLALNEARHERDRAEAAKISETAAREGADAQRRVADEQRGLAVKNLDSARQEADKLMVARVFLYRLLSPDNSPTENPPPRGVLDYVALESVNGFLNGHPETEEPLHAALGKSYYRGHFWRQAVREYEIALDRRRKMPPGDDFDEPAYQNFLGICTARMGDYPRSLAMIDASLANYRRRAFTGGYTVVLPNRVAALAALGRLDEAEASLRQLIELRRQFPDLHDDFLLALNLLAGERESQGDLAAPQLREAEQTLRGRLAKPATTQASR